MKEVAQMIKAIEAKPLAGYRLWIRFEDGTQGQVDLARLAGNGVFAAWNEPGAFESVSIGSHGEINWGDTIDLCPDALYMEITGKSPADMFPNLKAGVNV